MTNETILHVLLRDLRGVPPSEWERIASEAGVAKTLPRKLAYGDRPNPGVQTIQPLVDWFSKQKQARTHTDQASQATEKA